MSLLKPSININPTYATNGFDNGQAGWYQIEPTTSNLALRVSSSNIGMAGEIRLTSNVGSMVFQGYDGTNWIDFNATQGPQGLPGIDFINAVNFNNVSDNSDSSIVVSLGEIFSTTYANVAMNISNVDIRTIAGGNYDVNSNLTIQSVIISQNSNIITLTGQPLPYTWDFTNTNNQLSYLKNASVDTNYYSWGSKSSWIVKQGSTVVKGQAVIIDKEPTSGNNNIVITPLVYTTLTGISPFNNTSMNMLGIALNNASSGDICDVCTHGITTVLCTNQIISANFSTSTTVSVGLDGLVGKDGGIFYTTSTPTGIDYYTRAGYFLESGNVASNGNYVLFFVEPRVEHI